MVGHDIHMLELLLLEGTLSREDRVDAIELEIQLHELVVALKLVVCSILAHAAFVRHVGVVGFEESRLILGQVEGCPVDVVDFQEVFDLLYGAIPPNDGSLRVREIKILPQFPFRTLRPDLLYQFFDSDFFGSKEQQTWEYILVDGKVLVLNVDWVDEDVALVRGQSRSIYCNLLMLRSKGR
jgi:hypothetical protein